MLTAFQWFCSLVTLTSMAGLGLFVGSYKPWILSAVGAALWATYGIVTGQYALFSLNGILLVVAVLAARATYLTAKEDARLREAAIEERLRIAKQEAEQELAAAEARLRADEQAAKEREEAKRATGRLHHLDGYDPGPPTVIPSGPQKGQKKCCQMAAKFVPGLAEIRQDVPCPTGIVDFVEDWHAQDPVGYASGVGNQVTMRLRFCPFCGKEDDRFKVFRPLPE